MKKYKNIILLELYAIMLAMVHIPRGVVTDEAKYLLNIPYPHPPFARFIMSLTEGLLINEFFWRVAIATIVIQSVAFVWSMGRSLTEEQRSLLAAFWLLSAAVLLQAGTIMMAPLTAVQALIFLWLLDRAHLVQKYPTLVSLFWLVSLFTAYQIVLFLPVVVFVFWKTDIKRWKKLVCIGMPLFLLALYTLSNPLVPASMLLVGTQNTVLSGGERLENIILLWAVGGSLILSGLGTIGMLTRKRWELIASLLLVCLYVFLSYRFYYAMLFTPLFIAGVVAAPRVLCACRPYNTFLGIITIGIFLQYGPSEEFSVARQVAHQLRDVEGMVLINGSYGHEWQYELQQAPRRYQEQLLYKAGAVICLEECEGIEGFERVSDDPVEVWVKGE